MSKDDNIPVEALLALRRAETLELAKRYEESRNFYKVALDEAQKGKDNIADWPPATNGLFRIGQAIIIQQALEEADDLMAQDKWPEAIEKYKIVLQLDSSNNIAKNRCGLLQSAIEFKSDFQLRKKSLGNDSFQNIMTLVSLEREVSEVLKSIYESSLLKTYYSEILAEKENYREKIIDQIKDLISRSRLAFTYARKHSIIERALEMLDVAHTIDFLINDDEISDLRKQIREEANTLTELVRNSIEKEDYQFYQTQLEELLLENPLDKEVLFRLEWIRSKRRRFIRDNSRSQNVLLQEKDLRLQAKIWFWSSIATAIILLIISLYIILTSFNKENPLSSLTSLISVIPLIASRLVYDQSTAAQKRADDIRKELDRETEKDQELDRSEFESLQQRIFGSLVEGENK